MDIETMPHAMYFTGNTDTVNIDKDQSHTVSNNSVQ